MASASEVERTLKNLSVLAALSHNDKLITNGETFGIYAPTALRGLFRAAYGESRGSNVDRIRQTVQSAVYFAVRFAEDANELARSRSSTSASDGMAFRIRTNVVMHDRTCGALRSAIVGLENLKRTYRDDPAFASQVSLLTLQVEDSLRVMPRISRAAASARPPAPRRVEARVRYLPLSGSDAEDEDGGSGSDGERGGGGVVRLAEDGPAEEGDAA